MWKASEREDLTPGDQRVPVLGSPHLRCIAVDYDATRNVLAALERQGVRYAVFGAVALSLHGLARATEDLDLFVAPTRDNIERLRRALHLVFDDPHIAEIDTDELLTTYPAVQYIPPDSSFHIDILTRLGEAWAFEDLELERVDFDGIEVTVVSPQTLFRMKRGTVRPKDWGDADLLRRRFDLEE